MYDGKNYNKNYNHAQWKQCDILLECMSNVAIIQNLSYINI